VHLKISHKSGKALELSFITVRKPPLGGEDSAHPSG
jgi:hypothetical protein